MADETRRWAPQNQDTISALVEEILHLYRSGRTIIAVDGAGSRAFADLLADGIRSTGHDVVRASIGRDAAPAAIRATIIGPFRAGEVAEPREGTVPGDATLIVDGTELLSRELRSLWHFSVWLDSRGEGARDTSLRQHASAIIDNGDTEHPRRVFADSC